MNKKVCCTTQNKAVAPHPNSLGVVNTVAFQVPLPSPAHAHPDVVVDYTHPEVYSDVINDCLYDGEHLYDFLKFEGNKYEKPSVSRTSSAGYAMLKVEVNRYEKVSVSRTSSAGYEQLNV